MRKLIATVVVLALLAVGADIAGRLIAQQKASEALATHLDANTDPSVGIHGFSFLLQAVQGSYSHITIDADRLTLGPIDGATLHADLYDVHFPLSDAFSGTLAHLTAERAKLRAVIPGSELGKALQEPGLTLTEAGDGLVRIHTTVAVAGRTFPVTVDVAVSVTDNKLKLAARPVAAAGVTIPAQVSAGLQDRLTTTIPLTALPFPLESATATASDGNLVVGATATHIDAAQLGVTA